MRLFAPAIIGLILCLPASAQYAELGVSGGYGLFRQGELASFGGGEGSSTVFALSNGVRVGARMSFDFREFFAHEVAYAWQHTNFRETTDNQTDLIHTVSEMPTSIHNYYYNFTAHATPRDTQVRPFVTGGVGVSAFIPPGYSPPGYSTSISQGETKVGYNYGAGIKFLLSEKYGIRFDVRDHVTGKPFFRNVDGSLHNLETSMTVSYLF